MYICCFVWQIQNMFFIFFSNHRGQGSRGNKAEKHQERKKMEEDERKKETQRRRISDMFKKK